MLRRFCLESPRASTIRPISGVRRPRFRPSGSRPAASGCSRRPSSSSQSSPAPDRWCAATCRPSARWRRTRARPGRASWRYACYAAAGTRTAACCACPSVGSGCVSRSPSARPHAPDLSLVAGLPLPLPLSPGRVAVALAPLRRLPVGRHRTLLDQFLLASTVVLLGCGYQGGVDDLTAARDETLLEQ